ncbi:hypothetical protein BKH26_07445 [Actinomyces oris]|uniref:Viral protein TPX n=1 Tax=Actinomyces oris TaxID=544580 RepID=A0A1Q8VVN5_9ACTO|nr:hypothetical protein BKH27_09925 [Actinomyces oris]OLO55742.1 hypothetical protein BKH26_07445 [Actinomyces oris]
MRYLTLRHTTPVTSLVGMLCLTTSLLLVAAAPPSSAAALAKLTNEDKLSAEIVIKSDQEVTTTITITSPTSREKNLKEFCVESSFRQTPTKTDATFSNENGAPTCKATSTRAISQNKYVSHDGDEYVVDTYKDSTSDGSDNNSTPLTIVFPGKVTEADGGKIEGDEQNKVSFSTFYDHKARGKDTAQAASQPESSSTPSSSSTPTPGSTSSSHSSGGMTSIIVILIAIAVVGAAVAIVSNTLKKNREQKYLDALGQQSIQASTSIPASQPVAFPSQAQAGPLPTQPSSPASQQYQPPFPQGPGPTSHVPPNHNGYRG